MAAPTALAVSTDATVYSRLEPERDTIAVTITPTGTGMAGEQVTLELRKARRARDVVVASWTYTLASDAPFTEEIHLPSVVDEDAIPLVRRGLYFFRVSSVSTPAVVGVGDDFRVVLISMDRMLSEYLYGLDLKAIQQLSVLEQPKLVTGVTVTDVSPGHPRVWETLSHNGPVGNVSREGTAAAGSTTSVVNWTGGGLVVSAWVGSWLTVGTEHRLIQANTASAITVVEPFSAVPGVGASIQIQADTGQHTLSWCGGPQVRVPRSGTYTLRRSADSGDAQYIQVRVNYGALPVETTSEALLVTSKSMDTDAAYALLDKAINDLERTQLGGVFLEPTRIITNIPSTSVVDVPGTTVPSLVNADWDEIGTAISYYRPRGASYVNIVFPYKPILKFNWLNGYIGGFAALIVPKDWIQFNNYGNFVELVPFTLEALGRFVGVLLFQTIRGDAPIPSFWRYDAVVGFRETPPVLLEAVCKIAAIDFFTIAGQATNNAYASKSLSRDGVSERIDYTASAMYGIYSASITDMTNWLRKNMPRLRGAYTGPQVSVMVA